MVQSPTHLPSTKRRVASRRMASNPLGAQGEQIEDPEGESSVGYLANPNVFAAITVAYLALTSIRSPWLISGAPILTYTILYGASQGNRILPNVGLWPLLAAIHLIYFLAATSWLFYWFFLVGCYWLIFISLLYQSPFVSNMVRRSLRKALREIQFTSDKIALFDLPALEIDTDVDGLMVIRGVTISLSSLTIIAHGVEVGIKLSDDMELALTTDKVVVRLFRGIEIDDVYANIKGGEYEMSFGNLKESTVDSDGEAVMLSNTALLQAAGANKETARPTVVKMKSYMTGGSDPSDASAKEAYGSVTSLDTDNEQAHVVYQETLQYIADTSPIQKCIKSIRSKYKPTFGVTRNFDIEDERHLRATICSTLHDEPSIAHPPARSVKVTTLQHLSSDRTRRFLHRLPFLLRLLLNPLSYFHPVKVTAVTAAASGKWIRSVLQDKVLKQWSAQDGDVRKLESRIYEWLSDANFAFQMADINGVAQVPIFTAFDIITILRFNDVLAFRTLPKQVELEQIIRLGGADATFTIPTYLLPHHEHLLPPVPTREDEAEQKQRVKDADGMPKTIQAERELDQLKKDETNVTISAHIHLPGFLDQSLLDFVAALVKATKLVEMDKDPSPMEREVKGLKDFTSAIGLTVKEGLKRTAIDAVANDRWIAKLVGKITKKLETAQGDVGYSGDIPVPLKPYRDAAEPAAKILP